MDAAVLGDLLAPERRTDAPAYRVAGDRTRAHDYDSLCTMTWRTANLLRLYGVHGGSTVGIVDAPRQPDGEPAADRLGAPRSPSPGTPRPIPAVVVTLLGAATLGATVRIDPPHDHAADALVGPTAWLEGRAFDPATTPIGYGDSPADPDIVHFEEEVWSETPIAPPESVAPDAPVLSTGEDIFEQRVLLAAAERFAEQHGLTADDSVAVRAPLSQPGTVVGGILAPLIVGGTILVGDADGTVTVGPDGIDPASIPVEE